MKYKAGDKVAHHYRKDIGYGTVKAVRRGGLCDVTFDNASFSGVHISNFQSAEKMFEDDTRNKIIELIKKYDFNEAEKVYQNYSKNNGIIWWLDFQAYLKKKIKSHQLANKKKEKKEQIRLENEKLKGEQKKLLENLLNTDFINAEKMAIFPDNEYLCDFSDCKNLWLEKFFKRSNALINLCFEQRLAIGDVSHNCLLRARAGSGKTTVIKSKVDFLLRHVGFIPEDIMVLSFNKGAAQKIKKEVQKEFNHPAFLNARTFHSLAYQIVMPEQDLLFDVDSGANAKQSQFIEKLLKNEFNPVLKAEIYGFFRQEMQEVENLGSLLSNRDYYTLRRNSTQDTLNGESVKSLGEKWIADFLFEHDIRYVYERSWYRDSTGEKGNYYPDFSLAIACKLPDVVIEHWGINEFSLEKTVPEHWSQTWQLYREDMDIKREYWKNWNKNNPGRQVVFLETSILDTKHGREHFESILKDRLASINIKVCKLSIEERVERVVRKHTPKLAKMILQYISKAKKRCMSPDELDQKLQPFNFGCLKENIFVQLANRLYHRYQQETAIQNKIDYDDLMAQAVAMIHKKKGDVVLPLNRDTNIILNDLKWILIDEYQDFSVLFFKLIHALRQYNPGVRLFCVGDNWQAINGFAGSDLCYFNEFQSYFGNVTLLDLSNNYRSQPNIVKQSNHFMAHAEGIPSIPKAKVPSLPIKLSVTNRVFIEQRKNVSLKYNLDHKFISNIDSKGELTSIDPGATMARQFKLCYQIMHQHSFKNTSFMILSRNNYQAYGYENLNKFKHKLKTCFSKQELACFEDFDAQVNCMTVHRSKGAEADVVILLNVKERKFPIIHPDNQLYAFLGDTSEDIINEEERLFYVAITRAKQELYIFTEIEQESEFLYRIECEVQKNPLLIGLN